MAKISVGCRVAPSVAEALDALGARLGGSRGRVLEEAIAAYLRRDIPTTHESKIHDLTVRLAALEQRHQDLAQLVVTPR